MRLRHIEVFSAIMLTGSTSAVAKLLNISQPSVSKMLQHAERSIGFQLFKRSKGKLVATPEALLLQRELMPFDEELTRVRRLISSLSAGESGLLRIAATPALAHHLLPSALAQWRKAFPQSTCEISVANTREILDALLLNEMDFGLTMMPVSHPNIVATPLLHTRLCAIAPPGWWSAAALKLPLTVEELAGQPLIRIATLTYLGEVLATWLGNASRPPETAVTVQSYSLAKALVRTRLGIALVDEITAHDRQENDPIQIRALELRDSFPVYVLTEHNRPPPQSAERLFKFLKKVC